MGRRYPSWNQSGLDVVRQLNNAEANTSVRRPTVVKGLVVALVFAGAILGDDSRAQFDRLKAESQAAMTAGQWDVAESRLLQLMEMSAAVRPSIYEMYAEVVSPLAEVYRQTQATEKLESLYRKRAAESGPGLEKGLAQADLGFFLQGSDFASADRYRGEMLVEDAVHTFEGCAAAAKQGEACTRRLADTAGIQAAIFFQKVEYDRAEPLLRRVVDMPENLVQDEVMLVSLHALRGILVFRKEFDEAKQIEDRATAFAAAHPNALSRLQKNATRSRTR